MQSDFLEGILFCPYCNSREKIIRHGIARSKGGSKQRYRCMACNRYFVLNPNKTKGSKLARDIILRLAQEGYSSREIARILSRMNLPSVGTVHHGTISRWIKNHREQDWRDFTSEDHNQALEAKENVRKAQKSMNKLQKFFNQTKALINKI